MLVGTQYIQYTWLAVHLTVRTFSDEESRGHTLQGGLTFLTSDEEATDFAALQHIDLRSAWVSSRGRQAGIAEVFICLS